ncbi:MAG: helix-turn-helix domain-containing protein, partial [Deltaproteobacteria bacterium]|nr:helix-turn-helix domain-containing protein [Deltaproteobacteria bacterium]
AFESYFFQTFRLTGLSLVARVVLTAFRIRSHTKGYCWPKQTTLAGWIGLSLDQVKRAIRELKDAGWITVKRYGVFGRSYHPVFGDQPIDSVQDQHQDTAHVDQPAAPGKCADAPLMPLEGALMHHINEKNSFKRKKTNKHYPARAEAKTPPTSLASSVSLTHKINCFEDILTWSNHTCLRCGTTNKELAKVRIDNRKPMNDLSNLQPLCLSCYEAVAKDVKGVVKDIREDYRPGFVQAHGLPWQREFGPSPVEQAQDEFKTLVERLPDPKAKKFCLSKAMEAHLLAPVLRTA